MNYVMEQMPTQLIRRTAGVMKTIPDTIPVVKYRSLKHDFDQLKKAYAELEDSYTELDKMFDEALEMIDFYQNREAGDSVHHESGYNIEYQRGSGIRADAIKPIKGVDKVRANIDPLHGKFSLGIKFRR